MASQTQPTPTKAIDLVQRILLPRKGEPLDVRALYIVEDERNRARVQPTSRTSCHIGADSQVSFETYFNGFPASYWRRWTTLDSIVLKVTLKGEARVDVYRSKIDGSRIGIDGDLVELGEDGTGSVEFVISLDPFEDGGWVWFDITTDTDTEILDAGWYAPVAAPATITHRGVEHDNSARVAIGIPTFNRPTDAVAALEALASDPAVDAIIDAVIMPDQGTKVVTDEPGFAAAAGHFGDRYLRVQQGNLGGSGGYSRVMYEALEKTDSPFILYMDDDIAIEPDSILRAVAIARFARSPMLVGGQMLNLQERSHLHSMGEVIDRGSFMWTSAPHVEYDHDFARHPLRDRGDERWPGQRDSKNLHRRIDVDYNGWWMCLIPRLVAEEIGQPLPLFIKWDDAEYGLRAARAGYPTATWPGVAIWHMAWSDKDDAIDWQAYFHLRNRLVVAALYHEGSPRGIVTSMAKATLKHLLCLEYSTVAIQNQAIRDFLAGPDALFGMLEEALPRINEMRKQYPDAQVLRSATDLPRPENTPHDWASIPTSVPRKIRGVLRGVVTNLKTADPRAHEVPQANLPPIEARWFRLSRVDGATVTTADGRGVVFRQRDKDVAASLLADSAGLTKELYQRFDELRTAYRAAHEELTSRESWKQIFDAQ